MDAEDIAKQKLETISNTAELLRAIKMLEDKKMRMEDELQSRLRNVFENLKPINFLNQAFKEVRGPVPNAHNILRAGMGVGGGFFSKKTIIRKVKHTLKRAWEAIFKNEDMPYPEATPQHDSILLAKEHNDENKKWKQMKSNHKTTKAKPEILPKPTYWPFFLAIGVMFAGWGLLSFWLFSIIGFIVFAVSLFGWINDLRNE